MPSPDPSRPAGQPGPLLRPAAAAVLLCAAVLLVPFPAASAWSGGAYPELRSLQEAVGSGLVGFWSSSGDQLTWAAEFWARFHLVKATLAGMLLIALVLLATRVWRAFAFAGGRRRQGILSLVGLVTTSLTVLALLVLVANVQGAIAPLTSVLGVLPLSTATGPLAHTVDEIRFSLASGGPSPARDALVHDFVVYHLAMVAIGAAVTTGMLLLAVRMWRCRRRLPVAERQRRRLLVAASAVLVALTAFFALTTTANLSTAVDPGPALLAFLAGSF